MGKTHKHDYTHAPANRECLKSLADLLETIDQRNGICTASELDRIAATLPPRSAVVGSAEYADLIGWKISWTSTQGHRFFSPFLVAAERLLTGIAGTVIFNHAPPKSNEFKPRSRLYPQISYRGHNGSDHVALNRLTMDAQTGEAVWAGQDYHDCSPRALRIGMGPRSTAPARSTAISWAKAAFESAAPDVRPFETWQEYERHILRAFRLLDAGRIRMAEAAQNLIVAA